MYQKGDARLFTRAVYEQVYGEFDPGEEALGEEDSRCFEGHRRASFPYVRLDHSCNYWIIGGPAEVRMMIADLQAILTEMESSPSDR